MKKLSTIIILALLAVSTACAQTYSKELEEIAMKGDEFAMMELGYCYQSGSGIKQDYAKAMAWYKAASESNYFSSDAPYWMIGYLYDQGLGVNQDTFEAMEWWRKAIRHQLKYIKTNTKDGSRYFHHEGSFVLNEFIAKSEAKAFRITKEQAKKGVIPAMVDLSICYHKQIGDISKPDNKKAIEWCLKAAKNNDTTGMVLVGCFYEIEPRLISKIEKTEIFRYKSIARDWYRKAADLGCTMAMNLLCNLLKEVSFDYEFSELVFNYYKKYALARNDSELMNDIGNMYYHGFEDSTIYKTKTEFDCERVRAWYEEQKERWPKPKYYDISKGVARNYEKAFEWYQKSANLKNENSMFTLGYMYLSGLGTPKDEEKGLEWTQKAADAGHVIAWRNLGAVYYNKHDTVQARYWWQKAKEKGNLYATFGIGRLCYDAKDYAGAYECFKTSQGENHPNTMYCLGMMYKDGIKVQKDPIKAFELFKQAAESTNKDVNSDAMQMLSTCYRFGYGTSKDLDKAEYWLKKAQEAGNDTARGILLLMEESRISPETN